MDMFFYAFAGVTAIAVVLASLAIWAPRPTRVRVLAVVITALFIPVLYLQLIEMLSKPKPMSFEWFARDTDQAVLLGTSLHEGKSIYLWLRPVGSFEHRYYVVPWNMKLAEKLEDTIEAAVKQNSTIILKSPFIRRSFEEMGKLNVEIVPPPMPPMKRPPPPPRIFNPRAPSI